MNLYHSMSRVRATVAAVCMGLSAGSEAKAQEAFAPLFPFVISHDAPDNVTSMAHLLDAPAGRQGFVRVENGRFATDAGPVRFNGTNLTGPANFPSHEEADRLADRLARFGINCVRLHYFDAPYGNFRNEYQTGIYGVGDSVPMAFSADPGEVFPFDRTAVDRLDYLVAALKKRGIYVNLNLHVARFPKGLSFFVPDIIDSEKDYAKKLLTRVNPYTGLACTDDPCVAMIEINNENGLFKSYQKGWLDRLSGNHALELRRQWNAWLRKKYGSTTALREAWEGGATALCAEQIPEKNFDRAVRADGTAWSFDLGSARASAASENGVMKIRVEQAGRNYFPKLYRNGVTLRRGELYTLSFRVRCVEGESDVELGTAVAVTQNRWRSMGFLRTVRVGPEWTTVQASFTAAEDTDEAQFQLTRFKPGIYELDDLSIAGTPVTGLDENQRLEAGTVAAIEVDAAAPLAARRDFCRFLADTEGAYWMEMADYVKNQLKAKCPVSGTQLRYSPPFIQSELDYVDIHAYWCHPAPTTPKWRIGNVSQVNTLGVIQTLAAQRVVGKPYTVSEYNHPFPNRFGAEGQPLLRAYGALQGWDGVFEYTWHHRREREAGWNSYFFSISERTDVLAHMPACAAVFLRGDVHEANQTLAAAIDRDACFERLVSSKQMEAGIEHAGFQRPLTLIHKTGVDLSGRAGTDPASIDQEAAAGRVLTSDTGELCWNREDPDACYFTVNTAGTRLFSGFPKGRTVAMGDVTVKVGKTRLDWATVSLVSRFAPGGFGEEGKSANILLTATGLACNSGMELENLGSGKVSARNSDWGEAPVLVEGIPAVIGLPSRASRTRCYVLDPNGDRVTEVPVQQSAEGYAQITIGPEYKTIWYEIEVRQVPGKLRPEPCPAGQPGPAAACALKPRFDNVCRLPLTVGRVGFGCPDLLILVDKIEG